MADLNGPLIVRRTEPSYYLKPGLHSHNRMRQAHPSRGGHMIVYLRTILLVLGLCGIGYYAYTLIDQDVYQSYENWAFDQDIAGRRGVTFADYIRERTPFGFLVGAKAAQPRITTAPPPPEPSNIAPPATGSLLGRVEIPRLNLAAMVRQGVDAKTLSIAVGHVPSTALPGQPGNFAIAAHRDTLFRVLKDIQKGDLVKFESSDNTYTYQVLATKIVVPSNVSVLRPDGGGVIPATDLSSNPAQPDKLLTMITCYPFYYVGSAPKRFIVEAKLVPNDTASTITVPEASPAVEHHAQRRPVHSARVHSARAVHYEQAVAKHPKKRNFWHKLLFRPS